MYYKSLIIILLFGAQHGTSFSINYMLKKVYDKKKRKKKKGTSNTLHSNSQEKQLVCSPEDKGIIK